MATIRQVNLVLWGQGFDEIAAAILVGELRGRGHRVKMVGLSQQHAAGRYGLVLGADLTLDQALQSPGPIRSILVPAPWAALRQFSYDPRLAELLQAAAQDEAIVLAATPPVEERRPDTLLVYPPLAELIPFVHHVLSPRLGAL